MKADASTPVSESFATRLKSARKRAGLTLKELADQSEVTLQVVWNYENRGDDPPSKVLFLLADALSVDARWLATGRGASKLLDIEFYIAAAQQHGEDSDPDHEVGDLQDHLRTMWRLLTAEQRKAFALDEGVHATLEGALADFESELELL